MLIPYEVAERLVGIKEVPGVGDHPFVQACLYLDTHQVMHDETAWCSAFANWVCWLCRTTRSKSLAARSWLSVGMPVTLSLAGGGPTPGWDIVVLKRGGGDQPGPDVVNALGHVGFYSGYEPGLGMVNVLGGNQSNAVTIERFPVDRILGIRRVKVL